jgi:hypothetical protein
VLSRGRSFESCIRDMDVEIEFVCLARQSIKKMPKITHGASHEYQLLRYRFRHWLPHILLWRILVASHVGQHQRLRRRHHRLLPFRAFYSIQCLYWREYPDALSTPGYVKAPVVESVRSRAVEFEC